MQQAYADFGEFTTLTLYSDDEIDLGFGVAAAAGAGMQMPGTDPSHRGCCWTLRRRQARKKAPTSGSRSGSGGHAKAFRAGSWLSRWCRCGRRREPDDYFSMTESPELSGIVLDLTAGEEAEASVDFGFTLAFQVPPGGAAVTGA